MTHHLVHFIRAWFDDPRWAQETVEVHEIVLRHPEHGQLVYVVRGSGTPIWVCYECPPNLEEKLPGRMFVDAPGWHQGRVG